MCILTAEEGSEHYLPKVNQTSIFARHNKPGFQILAYSLTITSSTRAAMILPLPVVPGSGEGALKFIDLSGYPDIFDDLSKMCNLEFVVLDDSLGDDDSKTTLVVHEVGDYEATYVPNMGDFNRIDPRFRLPDEVWKKMPNYSDYGFAVFQLKISLSNREDEIENSVHPMAFEFPTRNHQKLFYPTVHVHDGDYHSKAGFHHALYCQLDHAYLEFAYARKLLKAATPKAVDIKNWIDQQRFWGAMGKNCDWFYPSEDIASTLIQIDKCKGVVDPDQRIYGMTLLGQYQNVDLWLGDIAQVKK